MELELWNIFQSSRGANATMILSVTIGIWIAARFASVARENDAPVLMKAIISIFALSGFAFGWMVITRAVNGWVVQATALSDLRESGTELSPIAILRSSEAFPDSFNAIFKSLIIKSTAKPKSN